MRPSVLIRAFFLISFHFSTIGSFIFCYVFFTVFVLGLLTQKPYILYRPCDVISTWQLAPVSLTVYLFITWVRRTAKTIFKMQQKQQRKNILCSLVVSDGLLCVFVCLFPAFHHRSWLRRALTFAMVAMVTSTHFMPAPHTADIFVWLV